MPYNLFLSFLAIRGTCVMVALPNDAVKFRAYSLVGSGQKLAGSKIGSIADIKDMLALAAERNAIAAAARATTAAASAMIAKASSVGELHALNAATTALHSPRTAAGRTPRENRRPFTGPALTSPRGGGSVVTGSTGKSSSPWTSGSGVNRDKKADTDGAHSQDRRRPSTSPALESGANVSQPPPNPAPQGELDVFPAWIRERKDFQVFFPRFADVVVTDDEILRQGVPKEPTDRNIVELQCLARWIMKIPSMATSLDLSQATEIAKLARYQALKPREFVFRKGDKGDACYLIFSGEVHILIDGQKIATVGKNSAFGDIALQIENATRGADVQAGFPAVFTGSAAASGSAAPAAAPTASALIGAEVLKILAEDYHKTLARFQTRRRKHLIGWLHAEVLLFRDCVESKLHYFELVSLDVPLKQGEVLYRQGDSIGALYIVRSGSVRLEVDIQYEHKHRWPVGKREWKERVHAAKSRIPFGFENQAGFFGFEMFVEGLQTRAYTVIADSPGVELVGLNRVDCFSPYFSFTPRAIDRILEKHDKCRELAAKQIHQRLKDFHQTASAQKKSFASVIEKGLPVSVAPKFHHSKETPQFQFPSLKPARWEAPNDVVRALQHSKPTSGRDHPQHATTSTAMASTSAPTSTSTAPRTINAYASFGKDTDVKPWQYESRVLGADDVEIKISHCGICGSDIHTLDSGWGPATYPCVVGHEIVGEVTLAGANVSELAVGDRVGVGAQVSACLNKNKREGEKECRQCATGQDAYCPHMVWTYNDLYKEDGAITYGGYADYVRVPAAYAFKIPESIPSDAAAPLLCAGVTVFTPFKELGVKAGDRVGVIGIGGLGHLGIQFAKALGATVVAFSRSQSKEAEARALGADEYVNYSDPEQAKRAAGGVHGVGVDVLLLTADANDMPYNLFLSFLAIRGTCVMVALPNDAVKFRAYSLVGSGQKLAGSKIGSIADIKDMLALAAERNQIPTRVEARGVGSGDGVGGLASVARSQLSSEGASS
ncbi:hypothetical protein PybrP1_004267, partial [[Pythium] brassicae (nom. inval.)]